MKKGSGCTLFFTLTSVLFILLVAQNKTSLQDIYQRKIGRTTESIKVDGLLDEEVWKSLQSATDFWVSFPMNVVLASRELNTLIG